MSHILRTSTEHKTASLADEGNSAYCQSSGAHNIKQIYILYRIPHNKTMNIRFDQGTLKEITTHICLHALLKFLLSSRAIQIDPFCSVQALCR